MTKTFFEVLFNPDEKTCFSNSVYGTMVYPPWLHQNTYFSINPMHTKRADANVTAYRNILVEFDGLTPEQQLERLEGVPYSTLVWSGGKSFHAIISLREALETRRQYNALVWRIQAKLPDMDKATANPSRFSRTPGVLRDNGKLQELIELKDRVDRSDIEAWLGPAEEFEEHEPLSIPGYIPPWTRSYLRLGSEPGQRNKDLFRAACDLARAGFDAVTIANMTAEVHGLDERESQNTIRSAFKNVTGQADKL